MTTTTIPRTPAERAERLETIDRQMATLARHEKRTAPQEKHYADLAAEYWQLQGEQVSDALRSGGEAGGLRVEGGASSREETERAQQGRARLFGSRDADGVRGQALDVLEGIERSGSHLERGTLDAVARAVEADESDLMSRYVRVAGDDAYRSAFHKIVRNPALGSHEWSTAEREAFARVQELQRAMSLSDTAGGFMVPLTLDPAITLSNAGTSNRSLRSAFTVKTIATDAWTGVTSAGVSAGWRAEAAETVDASPTMGEARIPVHRGDAWVPFSFEVGGDVPNFAAQMAALLTDAKERLEAAAFITGSGVGQPRGLVTAAVAAGKTVPTATADTLALGDVYRTKAAVPARWRADAGWLANEDVYDVVRQLAGSAAPSSPVWSDLGAALAPQLLGRPVWESSEMDGTVTAGEANRVLAYGSLKNYYAIDRVGTQIELAPMLMGPNNRPTGQRGFLMWFRTGGDLVVPDAVRVLDA